ncbi:hypothetical protein Rhal01_03685 [Rubritalea halochordaticola]|uniref:Uncharacterized protein n=1 Tax=Rubritalea halochordaticola TaxID=714537 RepID=A0ABP9V486_9BACT
MKLIIPVLALCLTLPSCKPEETEVHKEQSVVVEAPDYNPIGEGMKVLAFALIAVALIHGIATVMKQKGDDHE